MSNGNLFFGGQGYTGEIGHGTKVGGDRPCSCGRKGCLETVASDWSLLSASSEKIGRTLLFEELVELALQGNREVLASIQMLTDHLAVALSQTISLFNPECLYLQGRMFHQVPGLFSQLVEKTRDQTLPAIFETGTIKLASKTLLQGAVASAIASITATPVDSLRATLRGTNSVSAFSQAVVNPT
jgi:predicted NBD/HSP70 family sugar kinase